MDKKLADLGVRSSGLEKIGPVALQEGTLVLQNGRYWGERNKMSRSDHRTVQI